MVIKICLYGFLWIILWSLWSLILAIHENVEIIKWTEILKLPKCLKCKKKINRKCFLPIIGFLFQKNKCQTCNTRILVIKPILEVMTAFLFCIICYYTSELGIFHMIFWMLTSWILLLVSLCDIIWYEINLPLVILWEILVLLSILFWLYDWSVLWWALVFFIVFVILYYWSLYYTKLKYNSEDEWVWMWDLIISPYLWALLYIWIWSTTMYLEELFCSVLIFFILTSVFGIIVYLIQNIILNKKADFLSSEMAERSLPLVPSMVLALAVVILCHDVFFAYLVEFWDSFFENFMKITL